MPARVHRPISPLLPGLPGPCVSPLVTWGCTPGSVKKTERGGEGERARPASPFPPRLFSAYFQISGIFPQFGFAYFPSPGLIRTAPTGIPPGGRSPPPRPSPGPGPPTAPGPVPPPPPPPSQCPPRPPPISMMQVVDRTPTVPRSVAPSVMQFTNGIIQGNHKGTGFFLAPKVKR